MFASHRCEGGEGGGAVDDAQGDSLEGDGGPESLLAVEREDGVTTRLRS